jgi:hypothetical protein
MPSASRCTQLLKPSGKSVSEKTNPTISPINNPPINLPINTPRNSALHPEDGSGEAPFLGRESEPYKWTKSSSLPGTGGIKLAFGGG